MKVVCDACQAKYQIPDERVAGRRIKIRCRKCGATLVIRGDNDTARNSAVGSPSDGSVEWHVSLQGDQHGPYATDQMGDMLLGGQLAWDAYVWRESYGDWKLAGDSDTLVKAVARASSVSPEPPSAAKTPVAAYGSHPGFDPGEETPTRMMQSSPGLNDALRPSKRNSFAARAQSTQSQPQMVAVGDVPQARTSQPHMVAVGGGVQARSTSQPPHAAISGSYASVSSPTPIARARVGMEAALTGERHEDSVLFSARNLVAPSQHPTPAPISRPGYAQAEGSGLIDIRALAALTRNNANSSAAAQAGGQPAPGRNTQEEIFRLANQTGAFGNLDSIAPLDRPSHTPNSAVPWAILGGSLMIALAGVFAVYMLRPQPQPQTVAVSAPVQPQAATSAEPAAPRVQPGAAANTAPGPEAAAQKPATEEPAAAREDDSDTNAIKAARGALSAKVAKGGASKRGPAPAVAAAASANVAKTKPAKPEAEAAATPEAKPAKSSPSIDDLLLADKPEPKPAAKEPEAATAPAAPKGKRSIDDLLDDAVVKDGNGKKAASEAASAALPDTPSRDQVLAAMTGVKSDVLSCAEGQTLEAPTALVAINVAGASGKVTSAHVTGITGSVGSCIARAVRAASFPKFAREQFTINFPFKLKP